MARLQDRSDDAPLPSARQRRVGSGGVSAGLSGLLTALRLALAGALLLAALPGSAWAGTDFSSSGSDPYGSAPSGLSAGDQYVETLPTTKGPRAPGRGKHARKLSRGAERRLERLGGSDAAALKSLATSTSLGAPRDAAGSGKGSSGKGSHKGGSRNGTRPGKSTPAVPSAAINAVDGGEAGLGWLVLAILAITALALGAVGYQRHRDKGSAG
jgi:hypothetical protein